ncbi:hypothetical protein [Confluentibacter flavum]|nr:hypothetical protein [Confluentibacter flavum]
MLDSNLNSAYTNVGKIRILGLEVWTQFSTTKNWSNFIGANMYNYATNGVFVFRHRDGITKPYDVNSSNIKYSVNINFTYSFW